MSRKINEITKIIVSLLAMFVAVVICIIGFFIMFFMPFIVVFYLMDDWRFWFGFIVSLMLVIVYGKTNIEKRE